MIFEQDQKIYSIFDTKIWSTYKEIGEFQNEKNKEMNKGVVVI